MSTTLTIADLVASVEVKHSRTTRHVTRQVLSQYRGDVDAAVRRDQAIFGIRIVMTTEFVRFHAPQAVTA
jgi:hypothetical protein